MDLPSAASSPSSSFWQTRSVACCWRPFVSYPRRTGSSSYCTWRGSAIPGLKKSPAGRRQHIRACGEFVDARRKCRRGGKLRVDPFYGLRYGGDSRGPAIYTLVFAVMWWLNEVNAAGSRASSQTSSSPCWVLRKIEGMSRSAAGRVTGAACPQHSTRPARPLLKLEIPFDSRINL